MAQDTVNLLATLRNLFNPPDDVNFELHLNKHPKNHKNKSLSYALNMKISDDGSVIQNDESIRINDIGRILYQHYNANYKIIHIIPCNTELVLFVENTSQPYRYFDIWRYRESDKEFALFYNNQIGYSGGKFSSTFTYTSNNSLIIAFCEYGIDNLSPMMTINLGTFIGTKTKVNNIWPNDDKFNDRNLDSSKLPLCPEVIIPQLVNPQYSTNKAYTGVYYPYIRYKINAYDYTQWYSFGIPLINVSNDKYIMAKKSVLNEEGYEPGEISDDNKCENAHATKILYELSTKFTKEVDIINNSVIIDINLLDASYDKFQLGFICVAKTYTKYFKTEDLDIKSNVTFNIAIENLIEEEFNINKYENYFNVENIINKNNKLYISNYKTSNLEDLTEFANNNTTIKLIRGNKINADEIINYGNFKYNDVTWTYDDINKIYTLSPFGYNGETYPTNRHGVAEHLIYNAGLYGRNNRKYVPLILALFGSNLQNKLINNTIQIKYYTNECVDFLDHCGNDVSIVTKTIDITKVFITDFYAYDISKENIERCDDEYNDEDSPQYHNDNIIDLYYTKVWKRVGLIYIDENNNIVEVNGIYNNYFATASHYHRPEDPAFIVQDIHDFPIQIDFGNGFEYIETILQSKNWGIDQWNNDTDGNNGFRLSNNFTEISPNYIERYNNIIISKYSNTYFDTSLIQGDIYDFYIHYVDKYGNATRGYKLSCKDNYWKYYVGNPPGSQDITKYHDFIICSFKYNGYSYLVALNPNDYIILNGELNLPENIKLIAKGSTSYINDINKNNKILFIDGTNLNSAEKTYFTDTVLLNIKDIDEDKNYKWCDIFYYHIYNDVNDMVDFIPYTNINGDKLFRIPELIGGNDNKDTQLALNVQVAIPEGYNGYFISADKHQPINIVDGIGTTLLLYNDYLTLFNELSGNFIKTCNYQSFNLNETNKVNKLDFRNIEQIGVVNHIDLSLASDIQKGRAELGTCLNINDNTIEELSSQCIYNWIINVNHNIYTNQTKQLYRIGNIYYSTNNDIKLGFNGVFTKTLVNKIGYIRTNGGVDTDSKGFSVCTTKKGQRGFGHQLMCEIYRFYHNNQFSVYITQKAKQFVSQAVQELYYEVYNTINRYDVKCLNPSDNNPEIYEKYDDLFITEFNRTVYRSNVISDESKQNNWRFFETDAYKNIEENKGNITNLIAIGNYLYVHTEHSLFAFNDDNTLNTNNQNIQLGSVDIFDTEYKEQFRTTLGYGGLQDKEAWCAGEFGYIYYNNDNKELIKLYGNELDIISKDIKEWIYNLNPDAVRFCQDIKNNRILIQFRKDANKYVLSYNYKYKVFVSVHDYVYNLGYNTKNNLYMLIANDRFISEYKENDYGWNENSIIYNPNETILKNGKLYKLNFIINYFYNSVKYIENIIYKLRKFNIIADKNIDYTEFPVEKNIIQYSGNWLRVHNDLIDTGEMDINNLTHDNKPSNDVSDYTKPYWELGNWNFNLLRDIHNMPVNGNHDDMSRLYGNYFIIAFTFGNSQEVPITELLEFENLQVKLTEDKTI